MAALRSPMRPGACAARGIDCSSSWATARGDRQRRTFRSPANPRDRSYRIGRQARVLPSRGAARSAHDATYACLPCFLARTRRVRCERPRASSGDGGRVSLGDNTPLVSFKGACSGALFFSQYGQQFAAHPKLYENIIRNLSKNHGLIYSIKRQAMICAEQKSCRASLDRRHADR